MTGRAFASCGCSERCGRHPKIALAVYMEKSGGYGATVAAPVAQHIIAEYYGRNIPPL